MVTFLIVLGILALFGAGDVGDACAITLLLKVEPILFFRGDFCIFNVLERAKMNKL